MEKQPARITVTRQFLEKARTRLEAFFQFAEPDEQFRFMTFERNDYAENKLTMLIFDFIPDRVFVTVPQSYDLNKAVMEVIALNPDLSLEKVALYKIDKQAKRQTQELKIKFLPMTIDATGTLKTS